MRDVEPIVGHCAPVAAGPEGEGVLGVGGHGVESKSILGDGGITIAGGGRMWFVGGPSDECVGCFARFVGGSQEVLDDASFRRGERRFFGTGATSFEPGERDVLSSGACPGVSSFESSEQEGVDDDVELSEGVGED